MRSMKTVAEYVSPEALKDLATPSDMKLGWEIAENGDVEITEFGPERVIAVVQPQEGQRRTVELQATENGLECRCTCSRKARFCKHCMATAIAVGERYADDLPVEG
jgi:uncharacterized Zn finger protein